MTKATPTLMCIQIYCASGAARDNDGEMSLANLVLPGELRKALEALESSPEMTDTLLYSLIQLLNNPAKVSQLTPLTQLAYSDKMITL